MQKQLSYYLTVGFSLLWMLLIFLDYWYYHQPIYFDNLVNFQYGALSGLLILIGIGSYFLVTKLGNNNKPFVLANGLGMVLLFFVLCIFILSMHTKQLQIPIEINSSDNFIFLGSIVGVLFVTYLITACCFVLGDVVVEKIFSVSISKLEGILLKIALGMLMLSILLFGLGIFNFLFSYVVGPLLLLILGVFYKRVWKFVKSTLIQPITFVELNALGFASFFIILLFISLIYLQNIRPFPYGFDALAIYMNLPNLIGKQHGLISGYSPYYWSLFVAMGHILFNSLSVVISLSILGGVLSGFSIYAICKKWINRNYALFITALFFSLPMINFHAFRDIKTDLGLLFFMLVTLSILINYLAFIYPDVFSEKVVTTNPVKQRRKRQAASVVKIKREEKIVEGWLAKKVTKELEYIILLGLLSGMILGTKLTGLILIFSIIGALVLLKNGEIGFITAAILFLFIILAGKLDAASGLRNYHFGANQLMWATLVLGLIGLVYLWLRQRENLLAVLKSIGVYAMIVLVIYLPWPIKNYSETGRLSISTFIKGETTGKDVKVFIDKMQK